MTLIHVGTELDRAMIAFESLRAYSEGRDEVWQQHAASYSDSYLTFGLISVAAGMAFASEDDDAQMQKLHSLAPGVSLYENELLAQLDHLNAGAEYTVPTNTDRIVQEKHEALLAMAAASSGLLAAQKGVSMEQLLDYLQFGLMGEGLEDES